MSDRPPARVNRVLTGDCETDCVDGCAYPGRFSECSLEQPVWLPRPKPQKTIRVTTGKVTVHRKGETR